MDNELNDMPDPQEEAPEQESGGPKPAQQPQAPASGGEPTLSPEDRKKLDGIVTQLAQKNAPKEDVQAIVDDFKKKYAKAQTAAPGGAKTLDEFFKQTGIKSDAQIIDEKHRKQVENSTNTIHKVLGDDATTTEIAKSMATSDLKNKIADQFKVPTAADGTVDINHLQQLDKQLNSGGFKPITDEEIGTYKEAIKTNPVVQRHALNAYTQMNPAEAPKIKRAIYDTDAAKRAVTPEDKQLISQNSEAIEKGHLIYTPSSDPAVPGRLVRPTDLGVSLQDASKDRDRNIELFKLADDNKNDELIKNLEDKRKERMNPDIPTRAPSGLGGVTGEFIGGNANAMGKSAAVVWIPYAGQALAGGIMAHEFARTGYSKELERTYNSLRDKGISEDLALATAKDQAKKSMVVDAVVGGAMGAFGEPAKAAESIATSGARKVVADAFKQLPKKLAGDIPLGLIAAGGEGVKNIMGDRPIGEGMPEAFANMAVLHALTSTATAVIGKGAELAGKTKDRVMQSIVKVPSADIAGVLNDQVEKGILTPEEAIKTRAAVEEHKIADSKVDKKVKDPDTRLEVQKLISKKEDLEAEMKQLDNTFHPEKKEKIEAIKEKINEVSNSPEAKKDPTKEAEPAPEVKKEEPAAEVHPVQKALDNGDIKGGTAEVAKHALSTKEGTDQFVKDVADQALNKVSPDTTAPADARKAAEDTYGKDLVDYAVKEHPAEEKVPVEVEKPKVKIDLMRAKDLADSKDPVGFKGQHDIIKTDYKKLKSIVDCIWP